MSQANVVMQVRHVNPTTKIIAIQGDLSAVAETALMDAYGRTDEATVRTIILDCTRLAYMNSGGIGLLVTLLVRMKRRKQRLFCFGLVQHYQHIFAITRLNDVIKIYDTETEALADA